MRDEYLFFYKWVLDSAKILNFRRLTDLEAMGIAALTSMALAVDASEGEASWNVTGACIYPERFSQKFFRIS